MAPYAVASMPHVPKTPLVEGRSLAGVGGGKTLAEQVGVASRSD